MDKETARAMSKIFKDSFPVRMQRHKYQIAKLRDKIQELAKANKVNISKGFLSKFKKKSIPEIDGQIAALNAQISIMEREWLDGILTPLTVQDRWLCLNEQAAHRFTMMESLAEDKAVTPAKRRAYERTIEMICERIYLTAKLQHVFKRVVNGQHQEYFTFSEASNLDPSVVDEIMITYYKEFELADEELKKSLTSTARTN